MIQVLDAWEDIDVTEDCDVATKKVLRCIGCKHIPKGEGGNYIIFIKGYKGAKAGVPVARLLKHYKACVGIQLLELIQIQEAGCEHSLLLEIIDFKKSMPGARDVVHGSIRMSAKSAPSPSGSTSFSSMGSEAAPIDPGTFAKPKSKHLQRSIVDGAARCTAAQASLILFFITRYILSAALSFSTVQSIFFGDMVRILHPVFYDNFFPKSAYVFSHRYLDLVYNHVVNLVHGVLGRGTEYWSLAGDGLKGSVGQAVVNFTISRQGKHMFKDCVFQGGTPNTPQYHFELYEAQLKKSIDGSELTGDQIQAKYCCIIGDRVVYMCEAGRLIEEKYRMIFAIGYISHLLDLLSDDWGGVSEIKSIVSLGYVMVLLCKGIEDVSRPFRESCGLWEMFKTYLDTKS